MTPQSLIIKTKIPQLRLPLFCYQRSYISY